MGPTSLWVVLSIWSLIFHGPLVRAKIEVSSITKMSGGVYLGREFEGGERVVWWPDGEIAGGGGGNGERSKRKKERKKEEARRSSTETLCT
jgi:hypothetical protein